MTSDIKFYYVVTGWKKKYSFFSKYCSIIMSFKRCFITDYFLLKYDLEKNTTFSKSFKL